MESYSRASQKLIDLGLELLKETERSGQEHLIAFALDKSGKILSKSFNSYTKTHPEQAKYATRAGHPCKTFLHAEIGALVKAKSQVNELVVIRIGRNGLPRNAKPCSVCQLAIEAHGVKKIVHT